MSFKQTAIDALSLLIIFSAGYALGTALRLAVEYVGGAQ